ncbi:hypothetical protein F4778DRAFT_174166 [Xylariomycetidae sp. FL2044]|nr:hypothetical protein F4778DRAFT_174166 [Xylariomycetidae sp. FL2044]
MDSDFEVVQGHVSSFENGYATGAQSGGVVAGAGVGAGAGAGAGAGGAVAGAAPATPASASAPTAPPSHHNHHHHYPNKVSSPPKAHHAHNSSASADSLSTSPPSKHNILHYHRQSHNSSKLPAFRFADLKKDSIALPSLLQNHIPPSPVSPEPDQHPETQPNSTQESAPLPTHNHHPHHRSFSNNNNSVSPGQFSEASSPVRSRPSTFQTPSIPVDGAASADTKESIFTDYFTGNKAVSALLNADSVKSPTDSTETVVPSPQQRRPPASTRTNSIESVSGQTSGLTSQRTYATDNYQIGSPAGENTPEGAPGQRELLLPKTILRTASDERRASGARRPPVSYKPPVSANASGGTASIPPIRSFRSSGERRSLVLDMTARSSRPYDYGDDWTDSNHRDRTLRALEGRRGDDTSQITPPDSAGGRLDSDDSGDVFLRIAREEPPRRAGDGNGGGDNHSAISRVTRSGRRPLSLAMSSSYTPISPPQVTRRLSDQQETSRSRHMTDDQSVERSAPPVSYRRLSRGKDADETTLRGTTTPLRGSPLTPRSLAFQELSADRGSAYTRRRQPSVDGGSAVQSRLGSLKQTSVNYSHPRTYNSSPLVPRADNHKQDIHQSEAAHGVEGTDSTASTAAPSTVWDELDDLKSRIHRLELTGKLPPTSGAAISRASDERPPTAHTNATTLSASPKRGASSVVQPVDTPNGMKEGHPLLYSALAKSKQFLDVEVYGALETAANDALSLSSMMGTAGQPGPISSGASSVVGGGNATVTDRQLRRKADSICRSLTELCLALSEGAVQTQQQQIIAPPAEGSAVASPTVTKFSGVATQRRPSAAADRSLALHTSPRALSRFEEKRNSMFTSGGLPSPRYSSTTPATPTDSTTAGRRTSLLISRTRRAGTEEPEETRKQPSLLRTRRAGTEEPEEQPERRSLLARARRATIENDDDDTRLRTPSRAVTEVQGVRSANREYTSQLPAPPSASRESESLASSALPRRRIGSMALNTRLAQPSSVSALATPARRYFDRSTPDREGLNAVEKPAEDRPQRQFSLGRTGSLNKRSNRESMIAAPSLTNGGYR